ncbi:protein BatD [Opitutaceae bacterium EW11]|nr:protein BatD [Opitutaceae bacterium EW11]
MRIVRQTLLLCVALLAVALTAWSQTVHWEPPSGTLSFNQSNELQLVYDGCEPSDDPAVPAVPGLALQAVGRSSNMSIVNGRISQTVIVSFRARATQRSTVTIPAFSVNTNKGRAQVAPATYEVGEATVGQGSVSLDSVASSRLDMPKEVWTGQVFDVHYNLNVARRYFHSPGSNVEWNPAPLAVEEWSKPEVAETSTAGEPRIIITYKTRGFLKTPGDVTLNSANQLVNLTTGSPSFGFFSRPNLEQYAITSTRPTVRVLPLPSPAPGSFTGAVGQFKLESKVVPSSATVGEPITWTLTLSGTGNWPDISGLPSRDVSRDFRVVQPQARRSIKEGTLFDGSLAEDVVLIPTQPGTYTLGPINWTYFDAAKGEYQTVTTDKVTVSVSAAPAPATTPTPAGATPTPPASSTGAPSRPTPAATAPAAPQAIPVDPINGTKQALLPWNNRTFAIALLVPVPCILLCWALLALRRARRRDPNLPQREAQERLRLIVAEIRSTSDRQRSHALIQKWQHDTATLWKIPSAVPVSSQFAESAESALGAWGELWIQAERALYGTSGTLPPDWADRASRALDEKAVPRFSALQLFRPSNLLPFAAAVLFCLAAIPALHAADSARYAYDRGDFSAAETAWRKEVAVHPADWVSRYNLGLALAQQNRWGEASAQTFAAFVQHPRDPSVQWNLAVTVEHAGFAPADLGGFVNPSPFHSMARLCSPAEWQRVLVGAAALAALGLVCFLLVGYGHLGRIGTIAGSGLLGISLIVAILGSVSIGLYQEARDAGAAVVWKPSILRSVPTEADTTQKTSPLAPGSMAVIDKTFLGWSRLVFSNGQTGWVRQEDIVPLWK